MTAAERLYRNDVATDPMDWLGLTEPNSEGEDMETKEAHDLRQYIEPLAACFEQAQIIRRAADELDRLNVALGERIGERNGWRARAERAEKERDEAQRGWNMDAGAVEDLAARVTALEAGIRNAATDLREIEPCSRGDERQWVRRANLHPVAEALRALLSAAPAQPEPHAGVGGGYRLVHAAKYALAALECLESVPTLSPGTLSHAIHLLTNALGPDRGAQPEAE